MRIFLSYSDANRPQAEQMLGALKGKLPAAEIYFAPARNFVGAYWISALGDELARADAVVLLLGDMVGAWQELEYYEALKRNRELGRPLIAPVALTRNLPGLPFLEQFHRLIWTDAGFDTLLTNVLAALEGARTEDDGPLWRSTNPYRGLAAMRSEDAAYFFGREKITAEILDCLHTRSDRVITLVGNSGVGKSSIAEAGVLAALRSRLWPGDPGRPWPAGLEGSPSWLHVTIRPGEQPLRALARGFARTWLDDPAAIEDQALKWMDLLGRGSDLPAIADAARGQIAAHAAAQPPARTLLYIDQGEELYARSDSVQAARFSELIAEAAAQRDIVLLSSIRSDYYGRLQDNEVLFAVTDRVDVPPLNREQIERVIREPTVRLGVRFENPDIVTSIAAATAREPGGLPMLSFLMTQAWETMRRDKDGDGVLRLSSGLVDVSRPLSDRADQFVASHPASERALRDLFTLKLAHLPKEGEPVRRRARKSECTEEQWALAQELAGPDWRLLSTSESADGPVVEVSHETLLRSWHRLGRWLDSAREFLIWKGQLEEDRRAWELAAAADKPRALLTGLRLDAARMWRDERGGALADTDRAFIDASLGAAKAEAEQRRAVAARVEKQRLWITRLSLTGTIVFAALTALATSQWRAAERARAATAAEAIRASWLASLAVDRDAENFRYGVTDMYLSVQPIMDLRKLASLAPVAVFLSGPHSDELDLSNARRFGHYNIAFVDWAERYLIPGADDDALRSLTQPVYDRFGKTLARAYFYAHEDLRLDPETKQLAVARYAAAMADSTGDELTFKPGEALYQYENALCAVLDWSGTPRGATVSDYAGTGLAFWLRREMDGTSESFFELLRKLLRTYDADWQPEPAVGVRQRIEQALVGEWSSGADELALRADGHAIRKSGSVAGTPTTWRLVAVGNGSSFNRFFEIDIGGSQDYFSIDPVQYPDCAGFARGLTLASWPEGGRYEERGRLRFVTR